MARYRGPRARICRRLDFPVFESDKFSSIRKIIPPGQHGQSRRKNCQIMVFNLGKNNELNIYMVF